MAAENFFFIFFLGFRYVGRKKENKKKKTKQFMSSFACTVDSCEPRK